MTYGLRRGYGSGCSGSRRHHVLRQARSQQGVQAQGAHPSSPVTHIKPSEISIRPVYCTHAVIVPGVRLTAVQSHPSACTQARPAHAAEADEGQDEDLPAVDDLAIAALAAAGAPDPVGPVLRKALGEESDEEGEDFLAVTAADVGPTEEQKGTVITQQVLQLLACVLFKNAGHQAQDR